MLFTMTESEVDKGSSTVLNREALDTFNSFENRLSRLYPKKDKEKIIRNQISTRFPDLDHVQIDQIIDKLYVEAKTAMIELGKIAELDLNDPEIPLINACSSSALNATHALKSLYNKTLLGENQSFEFVAMDRIQKNIEQYFKFVEEKLDLTRTQDDDGNVYFEVKNGSTADEKTKATIVKLNGALRNCSTNPMDTSKEIYVSYANVSPYQWRLFLGKLARYNLPEPHSLHGLLRQESMVWLEDGKITGCILLVSDGESLEARWLYAESQKIIAPLISAACRAASARFSVDTTVYAAATIPSVVELMKRLGGDEFQNPADVLTFVRLLRK